MKGRNTLGLLVICALLGLYVYKFEAGAEKPDKTADRSVVQLAGFKKEADVQEITITRESDTLTLQRVAKKADAKDAKKDAKDAAGEDDWKIISPLKGDADRVATSAFIKTLLSAKAVSSYTKEQAKELSDADTGLGKPRVTLLLKDAKGKTGTVQFGESTLNKDNCFAQVQGKALVLLFAQAYVDENLIKKQVGDLRDKTLLALAANDAKSIELAYPAGSMKLAKNEKGNWELAAGAKKYPADANAVDNLLASLASTKIDKFVDPAPKSPASYGLDKPRVTITVSTGAKGEFGLSLGGSITEAPAQQPQMNPNQPPPQPEEKVYVQRRGETEVVQVPGSLYAALLKTPQDLRDKTILAVNTINATKVAYTVGTSTVELEKGAPVKDKPGVWQLKKPQALTADSKKVEKLLQDLKGLQATGFVDEPGALEQYGLDKPTCTIAIEEGTTKLPLLSIGKAASDGSGTFFKRADNPVVFKANGSLVRGLETKAERLRDLQVLRLDRTEIKSIVMKAKDRDTVTLTCRGASDWVYKIEPQPVKDAKEKPKPAEEKKADFGRVSGLLTDLEDVRGDEWMADKAPDLAKYGLKEPECTLVVTLNNGSKQTLLIGRDPDSKSMAAFAKAEGKDIVVRNDDGSYLMRFARSGQEFEPAPEQPMGGMPMGMPPG